MATSELTVLSSIKGYSHETEQDCKSRLDGDIPKWISRFCIAMGDIETGIGKLNRAEDVSYLRLKITSILLAKLLDGEASIRPTSTGFSEHFAYLFELLPVLDWHAFLLAIYRAHLVPEFVHLLLELEYTVQDVAFQKIRDWFEGQTQLIQDGASPEIFLNNTNKLAFLASLFAHTIPESLLAKPESITHMLECITVTSQSMQDVWCPISSSACNKFCEAVLERACMSLMQLMTKPSVKRIIEGIDALHLCRIANVVSDSMVRNMTKYNFLDSSTKLLEQMKRLPKEASMQDQDHICFSVLQSPIEQCRLVLENCIQRLMNEVDDTPRSKTTIIHLKSIMELVATHIQERKDGLGKAEIYSDQMSMHDDLSLSTIEHHLEGFDSMTKKFLLHIGKYSTANPKLYKLADCLRRNPECVARSAILDLIIDTLSRLDDTEVDDSDLKAITGVAYALQDLFWSGFTLLTLKSKIDLSNKVILDSQRVKLISEFPFNDQNKDSQMCTTFRTKQEKRLNVFFRSLVSSKSANDSVLSMAAEACLCWPEGMVTKLVSQAFANEQQNDLLVDIIKCFPGLISCKRDQEDDSLFWQCVHSRLLSHCENGEYNLVDNGINFIYNLTETCSNINPSLTNEFLHEVFSKSVVSSLNSVREMQNEEIHKPNRSPLPQLIGLKVLSSIIETSCFICCIDLHELACLCLCLGSHIDQSSQSWDYNLHFNPETYEVLIECFEYLLSKLCDQLENAAWDDQLSETLLKWVVNIVSTFQWTTQIRFIPVLRLNGNYKINVPQCLVEVCKTPNMFELSEEISYGPGTGLLPWYQCFVINPAICPISSLDIGNLSENDANLFSNGWIITLAQVLPYCLAHQWHTLFEASKILISDSKLIIPYDTKHIQILPIVNMKECIVILGAAKIMDRVVSLLSSQCCVHWTRAPVWLHFTKCYCMVISELVNDSAEFIKLSVGSQLFILSQLICMACDFMNALGSLNSVKVHVSCIENIFILALDLFSSFEKIVTNFMSECNGDLDAMSNTTTQMRQNKLRLSLQATDYISEMLQASSTLKNPQHHGTLTSKLNFMLPQPP